MGRVSLSADIKYVAVLAVQDYDCLQVWQITGRLRASQSQSQRLSSCSGPGQTAWPQTLVTSRSILCREIQSTQSLCNTDHPAAPRIKRQEQSDMGSAPTVTGQARYGVRHIVCHTTLYGQIIYSTRHCTIAMLPKTSYSTSYNADIHWHVRYAVRHHRKTYDVVYNVIRATGKNSPTMYNVIR